MVKLFCAIVGEAGSAFEVKIDDDESVSALKDAIKAKNKRTITCDAKDLQLFLAKKDGGTGAWLTEKDVKEGVSDTTGLKLLDAVRAEIGDVGLSQDDVRLQVAKEEVAALKGPVHVLVVVPEQEHAQTGLWLVTGSVDNALDTRGIRCKLYWMATLRIGYYDPVRRIGNKNVAFWYEDKKLPPCFDQNRRCCFAVRN
ncbi:hypothetical protein PC114_g1464 [Phytophthora cactorum]|nr:hypothetical protein PC114_g1464 [Phytophthora cactorum]KAG3104928.1 hypothetical protein PC122_g1087 [Phytophthora cactorum]